MSEASREQIEQQFKDEGRPAVGGLEDQIPGRKVRDSADWICEYGLRTDDRAVVLQFFPKKIIPDIKDAEGNPVAGWVEDYKMDKRLDHALKMFGGEDLNAKFIEWTNSFNVIISQHAFAWPDPWPVIEKFFVAVETHEA